MTLTENKNFSKFKNHFFDCIMTGQGWVTHHIKVFAGGVVQNQFVIEFTLQNTLFYIHVNNNFLLRQQDDVMFHNNVYFFFFYAFENYFGRQLIIKILNELFFGRTFLVVTLTDRETHLQICIHKKYGRVTCNQMSVDTF